jgi:hypothetical protein
MSKRTEAKNDYDWIANQVGTNRASVVFSIQSWLGESEDSKKNSTTPGYFSVGMSSMWPPISFLPIESMC